MKIIFTDHARFRMSLRKIEEDMVKQALLDPERRGEGYRDRLLVYKLFAAGRIKVVYVIEDGSYIIISVIWEEKEGGNGDANYL